jgi:hypothetical protein
MKKEHAFARASEHAFTRATTLTTLERHDKQAHETFLDNRNQTLTSDSSTVFPTGKHVI